jgi:hypothetical protein
MRDREAQIDLFGCSWFKSGGPACLDVQKPEERNGTICLHSGGQ